MDRSLPAQTPLAAGMLNEHEAKQLLRKYDLPVVAETLVPNAEQALQAADRFGFPVVLKAVGEALQHKTERGLVHVNLSDAQALRRAADRIARDAGKDLQAYLVQPYITGQRELMAGLFRDPQFGPVILFGLGGTLTEALGDISLRQAPLTPNDIQGMISEIRAQKLLEPFRGEAAVNRSMLVQVLAGLSRLALEHPEISEVDINPLRVTPNGELVAVDALITVRSAQQMPVSNRSVSPREIHAFFNPRAIAFVGASAQLGKWGNMLVINTISGGYKGDIFLVNPKGAKIAGRPSYARLADIPGPIDLAVVTVPAAKVIDLIPQCQAKGIQHVVLITSGFAEIGPAGRALQEQLVQAARQAGITILGPNTMGITNPHIQLYSTGATVTPLPGHTVMVAQSGNMGSQLLGFAEQQGIGIRAFAGSGNEAMITMADYLEGFEVDEQAHTILIYLEGLQNGRRFFESARRVSRRKPIVLLKGGQTQAGQKAAASHSGAMASDIRVFEALCHQSGIIRVYRPMDLLDLAAAFDAVPLPRGPRVAIMTFGGGWGVVTADLCQRQGLVLPDLELELEQQLSRLLPAYWSHANPVDMVGDFDPSITLSILELLMRWQGCDAVINLGIMGRQPLMERLIHAAQVSDPDFPSALPDQVREMVMQFENLFLTRAVELMEELQKPILGVSLRADASYKTVTSVPKQQYKGVFYQTPERAVHALAKMVSYQRFLADSR